jgi:hypothetical protein
MPETSPPGASFAPALAIMVLADYASALLPALEQAPVEHALSR